MALLSPWCWAREASTAGALVPLTIFICRWMALEHVQHSKPRSRHANFLPTCRINMAAPYRMMGGDQHDEHTPAQPPTDGGPVYVFVDNSNLFIRGKVAVAGLEKCGELTNNNTERALQSLQIDYGQLMEVLLAGRKLGHAYLAGSRPPNTDTFWDTIRGCGYEVGLYDRGGDNKEKEVDMAIGTKIMRTILTQPRGTIVLVAGDGDYNPVVGEILKENWPIEITFWSIGALQHTLTFDVQHTDSPIPSQMAAGLAHRLKDNKSVVFRSLDTDYKRFCFSTCETDWYSCEFEYPLEDKSNSSVFLFARDIHDEFVWWSWEGDYLRLYFSNKSKAGDFCTKFTKKYPELVPFHKNPKKRKASVT